MKLMTQEIEKIRSGIWCLQSADVYTNIESHFDGCPKDKLFTPRVWGQLLYLLAQDIEEVESYGINVDVSMSNLQLCESEEGKWLALKNISPTNKDNHDELISFIDEVSRRVGLEIVVRDTLSETVFATFECTSAFKEIQN